MSKLIKYFRWYDYLLITLTIILTFLRVGFDLTLPDLMADIVSVVIENGSRSEIFSIGLEMLLYTVLAVISVFFISFLSSKVAARFANILRRKMYEKVQSFSAEEMNDFSVASLITRTTNDIQQVQNLVVSSLRMALRAPILAVGAIIKIWGRSSSLTLVTGISIFLIVVVITFIFIKVGPKFKIVQENIDDLNLVTRENLTGLREVRAHNAEEYQKEKFERVNEKLTNTNIYVNRILMMMHPFMNLILSGTSLAIVWVGAYLISQNSINLPTMMAFSQYAVQTVMGFMMLTITLMMFPRSFVSARRVSEVLQTKAKINSPLEPVTKTGETGTIEFKDVSFRHKDAEEYILKNINLKINKGETIGFIGSTGSGKSTLINLILRFYDVSEGTLFINGQNIKDYPLEQLHDLVGYIPQRAILFSGTIASNLRLGKKDASEEEMLQALKTADMDKFIKRQEDGLQYKVSRAGQNFSGGQKQRLSIARGIIKQREFFVFDDTFSALDNKTDSRVRKNLIKHIKGATTLIVSQRVGTIMNSDKIVVLDKGEIVGFGTHRELLKENKIYQEIASSQLSKENL
ncbi:TPA: ABC transporter ATP-binding protein [bacterium]|nr:ABC transporter ATP-binding protein [bacterium]